jgi:hypothetical protein
MGWTNGTRSAVRKPVRRLKNHEEKVPVVNATALLSLHQ